MEILLKQDDCAPDSFESFCKDFIKVTNMSLQEFLIKSKIKDSIIRVHYLVDDYLLEFCADHPFYVLYLMEGGDEH